MAKLIYLKEFKLFNQEYVDEFNQKAKGITNSNDYNYLYPRSQETNLYLLTEIEFKEKYKEEDWDNLIKVLERDCPKFLNELKENEVDPIFRGYKEIKDIEKSGGYVKKTPRTDRRPKDMDQGISDMFDEEFYKRFGYKLRSNGIFTSKHHGCASGYGTITNKNLFIKQYHIDNTNLTRKSGYMFFPIGDYSYYWNQNIFDLFSDIENYFWYGGEGYEDDLFMRWEEEYGNPLHGLYGAKGEFFVFGKGTGTNKIKELVRLLKNPEKLGISEEDAESLFIPGTDRIDSNNIYDIEWVPQVEFDDYKYKGEPDFDSARSDIREIVSGYKESEGLDQIGQQEITFICNEFYLVDDSFYAHMIDYIKKK